MKNYLSTRLGIILVGAFIGVAAVLLQYFGNPPNMGICVACFERDIAGSLGFHTAKIVQYLRPEIIGLLVGAFLVSLIKKEFRPRGGSSTIIRFFLGIFAMIGALVFLGCPWRTILRIAGGDLNAIIGLLGLLFGVSIGVVFLKKGYNLGRSQSLKSPAAGYLMPAMMLALLLLQLIGFSKLQISEGGPGSMHAPIIISLIAGLLIGIIAQRSRFCTMGSFRDAILIRDFHLLSGIAAMLVSALIVNLLLKQFKLGFEAQPVAHTQTLWNFAGMTLSGLAFALAGGCPGRQLILSGEGDTDAGIFVIGMIVGAGVSHNFGLASTPKGIGDFGAIATLIGLVFCLIIGFVMIEKRIKK